MKTAEARAKVNLTLHVTGQRSDGYHLLDSLVVFADLSDTLWCEPSENGISVAVTGPFADGVPTDERNLIWRAASLMQRTNGIAKGVALTLEKRLPHAAGLGSGSADAATTLRMMSECFGVPELAATDPQVLALGADVPVCCHAPTPMIMTGIGEQLRPASGLPAAAMVLVNPRAAVPTGAVFGGLSRKDNAPMDPLPSGLTFGDFVGWLRKQRNDLQSPAIRIAPAVGTVLAALANDPRIAWSGMSGSGATCVGLAPDLTQAKAAASAIAASNPTWWVSATMMSTPV